ncbi:hypothetical protein Rhopal_001986-T1 [Rhodotorula paludigena]|uniref:Sugar phosphate transporter domain-containing protein n=1 Tax=Rhodotorula paludigena TaxID=86838 RepID=A0AAV5G937_9BASI|nr:hypothetical protein Rhopal_001986-T1 [Rhodotorula paludigena]
MSQSDAPRYRQSHGQSAYRSDTPYDVAAASHGFVFLCCLWYLSSAFSSNTGKSILTRFRYPVTLTFVQFAFVAAYCVLILSLRERWAGSSGHASGGLTRRRGSMSTLGGWGIRKPSRHMFHGTFMMSLFQIAGHVFSSMAIARVPVSTVHTIKALSPLFTVLSYAALFGVRYSSATYTALLPLTVGVMLACSFDLRANAIGFLCALGSTFIFVAQNIFSKKLLPKENVGVVSAEEKSAPSSSSGGAAKLDKLNLLFYSSGMAFVLMIPIWLYSDASALFLGASSTTSATADNSTGTLLFFFFANGTVHFAQNLLAFSILARTSPVTYSIASLVKRIAVICIAIVWSGQHVSLIQAAGMTSTFVGLWMYNKAKSDVDKGETRRVQVEKRHDLALPTTVGDARDLDGGTTPPPPMSLHSAYPMGPLSPRQQHGGSTYSSGADVHPPSFPAMNGTVPAVYNGMANHADGAPFTSPNGTMRASTTSLPTQQPPPAKGSTSIAYSKPTHNARNRQSSTSRDPPRDKAAAIAAAAADVPVTLHHHQQQQHHGVGIAPVPTSLFGPVAAGGGNTAYR